MAATLQIGYQRDGAAWLDPDAGVVRARYRRACAGSSGVVPVEPLQPGPEWAMPRAMIEALARETGVDFDDAKLLEIANALPPKLLVFTVQLEKKE